MTTITYTEQGVIIDGHAENPVACHGISAISQMVANFAEKRGWVDIAVGDGHLEIQNMSDEHCINVYRSTPVKWIGRRTQHHPSGQRY